MELSALVRDYGDIDAEAAACREECALFDFSFMARGAVRGSDARLRVQALTPRLLEGLAPGRIAYALRLDTEGHAVADLTIWHMSDGSFEVFSGRREDIAAIAGVQDLSDQSCILALQGPESLDALAAIVPVERIATVPYFGFASADIAGAPCLIGRLGYTGERGFEIVGPVAAKARLWEVLARYGRPAGFAAADILRIEAGFILFANELRLRVTPAELGLVRFAGAAARRPRLTLVGFTGSAASRPVLFAPDSDLEEPDQGQIAVTSAAWSARVGCVIGLGFIRADDSGTTFVDATGRFRDVRRARIPFLDPEKRRVRGGWSFDRQR